jgi:hypothetical protein
VKQKIATAIQVVGAVIAAVSVGLVYIPAGGLVLATGMIIFGLAMERS